MRRYLLFVLLGLAMTAVVPACALAASSRGAEMRAEHALKHAQQLESGSGSASGRDLTTALGELFKLKGALGPSDRKQANALLARPTDSEASPGHAYSPGATQAAVCGTHFCVHYVTNTADAPPLTDTTPANGIPDYVDSMLAAFENEVYPCENTSTLTACAGQPGAGWPGPKSDGSLGGGPTSGLTDVYIEDLPTDLFGYAAPDPTQTVTDETAYAYLVMDDDYAEFGYPDVMVPVRVTAAHEYNHVLQYGIDYLEDTWMFESTATYFEELVYPALNDYLNYMNTWVASLADPLTDANGGSGLKMYGSAVWNHFIAERHGADTIRQAWLAKFQDSGGSFAPGSYGVAIVANGGTSFSDEFEDFATAVAEWNTPNSDFPDQYPDVPASLRPDMPIDAAPVTIPINHTAFAFRNVPIPSTPGTTITLSATLPSVLQGAIALVARTGNSPTAGTVTRVIKRVGGGTARVSLPNADTYGRITAVLINADVSHGNWDPNTQDWVFTKDGQHFDGVRVQTGVPQNPPIVTTGAPTRISSSGATMNGTVNPNGTPTSYYFEYGPNTAYGTQVPIPAANLGSGTSVAAVGQAVDNLAPDTTIHYRLVATNTDGTAVGDDQTFTTNPPPVVTPSVLGSTTPTSPTTTSGSTTNSTSTRFVLAFTITSGKLRTILRRGLATHPRCTVSCRLVAKLVLPAKVAKKLKLKPTVATATGRGGSVLKLRISKKAARALGRLRKVSFKVTISATAQDGRKARLTRSITLRR